MWKSALSFALVGPLVGFAPIAIWILALAIGYRSEGTLGEVIYLFLVMPLISLAMTYVVGAPAAFLVGAMQHVLLDRGMKHPLVVLASGALGFALSALTLCGLDIFAMPRPHLGSAPTFGWNMWLSTGAIGGAAAAICTLFTPRATTL